MFEYIVRINQYFAKGLLEKKFLCKKKKGNDFSLKSWNVGFDDSFDVESWIKKVFIASLDNLQTFDPRINSVGYFWTTVIASWRVAICPGINYNAKLLITIIESNLKGAH